MFGKKMFGKKLLKRYVWQKIALLLAMFGKKLLKRPLSRYCNTLTATLSLQHTHCSTLTAAHSLQHTHCSTLTATHCNTLQYAKLWQLNKLRTLQRTTKYPSRNPNINAQSTGW